MATRRSLALVLAALCLAPLCAAGLPVVDSAPWGAWVTTRISTPTILGAYVAVDALGLAHIAWSRGDVYYGSFDGVTLTTTKVTPGLSTHVRGLALDAYGRPHIMFYATGLNNPPDKSNLQYAYFDGTSWQREIADAAQDAGVDGTFRLGSDGIPRAFYNAGGTTMAIRYAWRDSSGWHIERVDNLGRPWMDLDLDSANEPHAASALPAGATSTIAYYKRVAGTWTKEIVDPTGGRGVSIAVDSSGGIHIAYRDGSPLGYAMKSPSGWQITNPSPGPLDATSIDIDSTGRPHIAYLGARATYVTVGPTGEWMTETMDQLREDGSEVDLTLDAHDRPRVFYKAFDASAWLAEPAAVSAMRPVGS